jgi:hypothetical protein
MPRPDKEDFFAGRFPASVRARDASRPRAIHLDRTDARFSFSRRFRPASRTPCNSRGKGGVARGLMEPGYSPPRWYEYATAHN